MKQSSKSPKSSGSDYRKYLWFLLYGVILSIIWQIIAHDMYAYDIFPKIFSINVYPLAAWTLGLFYVAFVYDALLAMFGRNRAIILSMIFYWVLLILVETAFYHLFGFKDIAVSAYPGLPLCDCIHGPVWMQATYLLMGPIMIAIMTLHNSLHQK